MKDAQIAFARRIPKMGPASTRPTSTPRKLANLFISRAASIFEGNSVGCEL